MTHGHSLLDSEYLVFHWKLALALLVFSHL